MTRHNIKTYKSFQPKEEKNTFRTHNEALRPINNTTIQYEESRRANINEANKRVSKNK